jgi:hypothetical protein
MRRHKKALLMYPIGSHEQADLFVDCPLSQILIVRSGPGVWVRRTEKLSFR